MARRKRHEGVCHICGGFGPLSFEHVPPRAAFNDRAVVVAKFETAIVLGPDATPKGEIQQKGMGGYTLCERCNNRTGGWYGGHFVDWCYQGMDILKRSHGQPSLIYLTYVFPLSIIKQIVTMFFSVNAEQFAQANPELVRFVLNKEAKYLPPRYRVFVYYNTSGRFRSIGLSAIIHSGASSAIHAVSEITFPPFGYVMTFDSEPPDERLVDITHFARRSYGEFYAVQLKLPVLPTHLSYPGDYRTREEIEEQRSRNS